jgi:competence ComEA-like helix-hairpin-helix protein
MAKKSKVNLNNADLETLQQLPGIGRSLAERIVAGRPFQRVEDLLEVQGVGQGRFERIKTDLKIEEVERFETDLELDEPKVLVSEDGRDSGSILEEIESDLEAERPHVEQVVPSEPSIRKTLSRGQSLTLMFGVGIIAIILSVVTTLVIMQGINETLDFNQLQSIQGLESELGDLQGNLENLSSSLDAFDQRVTPLEGLDETVADLEVQLGSIQSDVDKALLSVGTMQTELDTVQTETQRLSTQVMRFDNFLNGLTELMRSISSPVNAE